MKLTIKSIVAFLVFGTCALFLMDTEVSIWLGGTGIQSRFLLAPITRYLAQVATPQGLDWRIVWECLYAFSFVLNFGIYAAAFWMGNFSKKAQSPRRTYILLGVQAACALVGYIPLFQLLAAEVAFRLPLRKALLAVGIFSVLDFIVNLPYFFGWTGMEVPQSSYLYFVISGIFMDQVFFFGLGYIASLANRSRIELSTAHNELLATQQFLGEAIRSSERVRIARELHDSIGHNLTALNLHLDLATRQAGAVVPESIQTARELGQQLLADIRVAVTNERRDQTIDLHQALQTLCTGIPSPQVSLTINSQFENTTPGVAHTLFCCTQESITNAIRHASASKVNVAIANDDTGISLTIADDGIGLKNYSEGNGLRGIRERIEMHQGKMELSNSNGKGCVVWIRIPQHQTGAFQ